MTSRRQVLHLACDPGERWEGSAKIRRGGAVALGEHLPGAPFVDRVRELAQLRAAWRAVGPQGQVVALVAEPGSGKSSLITKFAQTAEAEGVAVVVARGHEGELGLPYIVIADLLRAAVPIRAGLTDRLSPGVALEVSRFAPELVPSASTTPPAVASPAGQARLFSAIAATLREIFVDEPGVVVLEDLQQVDQRSLDVLGYLVRRLPELPLLLVVSWSAENPERLRGVVSAIASATESGRGRTVFLEPFGESAVRELLAVIGAPDADLEKLLDETRGLPLLVRAYGDALVGGDSGGETPTSAREVLSRRLSAVGQPTAQLISAAAVLGRGFDAELLRSVSGRGEAEVVDGLEVALAHLLLVEAPPRETAGDPTYDFPYEALRRVAYDATSLARRRLIHGRAADVLVRRFERDSATMRRDSPIPVRRWLRSTTSPGSWRRSVDQTRRWSRQRGPWRWDRSTAIGTGSPPYTPIWRTCSRPAASTRPPEITSKSRRGSSPGWMLAARSGPRSGPSSSGEATADRSR